MGNSNCGCGCSSKEGKENEEVRFTEVKKEIVDQEDVDDDDEFRIRPMEFYMQTKKDIIKVKAKNEIEEGSIEESGETIRNSSDEDDEEKKETESVVVTNEGNGVIELAKEKAKDVYERYHRLEEDSNR